MPSPIWANFYKTFTYAFSDDPISKKISTRDIVGAGIQNPDSVPSISPDGGFYGTQDQRLVRFRESNDFIDLSTISNRMSRYKEYERLRSMPEIESVLNVYADEACLAGNTKISTPFGEKTIKELYETKKDQKFLVYCYDFEKKDYTLGWAYDVRITKKAETVKVYFDNGEYIECTADHKILLRDGSWKQAGDLKYLDQLMPFYRIKANPELTKSKINQFPRIYTHSKGWIHERQFIDEFKAEKDLDKYAKINETTKLISMGLKCKDVATITKVDWRTTKYRMSKNGFSVREMKFLKTYKDRRTVIVVEKGSYQDVYDMTVEKHHNFATNSIIVHNCQRDNEGNVFQLSSDNQDVKSELEFLFYHRSMLNMNRRIWGDFKNLLVFGDLFYEIIINEENPTEGIHKAARLPADSMYRIETTKGKVVEFQQSKEGPDYNSLLSSPVVDSPDAQMLNSTAIRFAPEQIIHVRIGEDRKSFYPYGVSIIEPARGPAQQVKLCEDAMLVYRLSRAPERRVFYIDVGTLPPFKAESFIERMKDQFRKRKTTMRGLSNTGPNSVDERWHAPAQDEDYWLPVRPNTNTRIETLPGAQNLGEVDDCLYFRNKLFVALNFPKNYFNVEDVNITKISLSAQDVRFARLIERFQSCMEDGMWEMADRHLRLKGFPKEAYADLTIKMTAPSDWRELSRADVMAARITNATSLKSSLMLSDYDILNKWMKYSNEETQEIIARMKIQKLEDAKMQILTQNPQLLGVGIPAEGGEKENPEIGSEQGGPNTLLAPPEDNPNPETGSEIPPTEAGATTTAKSGGMPLPEPSEKDLEKYDMNIEDYASEQDNQDIDYSEES